MRVSRTFVQSGQHSPAPEDMDAEGMEAEDMDAEDMDARRLRV